MTQAERVLVAQFIAAHGVTVCPAHRAANARTFGRRYMTPMIGRWIIRGI
jgi:hypothetical protein